MMDGGYLDFFCILICGGISFVYLASGNVQPFNEFKEDAEDLLLRPNGEFFAYFLMKFPHVLSSCLPQRVVVTTECFICLVVSYMMRFCFAFTVIEMTETFGAKYDPNSCPFPGNKSDINTTKEMEFHWTVFQQGIIHSGLFWGYISTQVLGGVLSDLFDHKAVFLVGLLVTCITTAITPTMTRTYDWIGLIICRVIVGMAQGVFYNSLHSLTAHWIPLNERATLGTLVFAGVQFGSALNTFITSEMLVYYDWSVVFYTYSILGVFTAVVFVFTTYSHPGDVPHLNEKEKAIFEDYKAHVEHMKEHKVVPVKKIMVNFHVWAIFFAMFGQDWGFYTIITYIPTYLNAVLHMDIQSNGAVNAAAYTLLWVIGMLAGLLADWIQRKNLITLSWNRRILYIVSTTIHSLGFLGVSYAECNEVLVIVYFMIGMASVGLFYPSVKVNPMDLSPNFAGTIGSIGQMGGCLAGVLVPNVVGFLTPNNFHSEWRVVFWISFLCVFSGGVLFFLLSSAEIQPFNDFLQEARKRKPKTKKSETKK